jgi:hemerythrin-like domain-containing protein
MSKIGEPLADTRDMYMVHAMFRREFGLLPALVRDAADGDGERVATVVDHLELISSILTHHHHAEDVHIWPRLVERTYSEAAGIVGIMESQHARIDKLDIRIAEAAGNWHASASAADGLVLADCLDELVEVVNEHMKVEETLALPLMGRYITAAEWQTMVQEAGGAIAPESLALAFGLVMYEAQPDVLEMVLLTLPEEIRPALKPAAQQAFTAHSQAVHGTATPRRSTELSR